MFLLISIFVGTAVDYLGMWLDWWDDKHQLQVLSHDIAYLGENFTTSIFGMPPADLALQLATWVNDKLSISIHRRPNEANIYRIYHAAVESFNPFWQNFIYSAMTAVVRLFIIILSVAFYLIVFLVAMIDGLVQRELRKEGGGIEHAQIYHHAKTWIGRILIISPMIYLAWPESINPNWIVLPSAGAFGLSVFITFSTFKKFL